MDLAGSCSLPLLFLGSKISTPIKSCTACFSSTNDTGTVTRAIASSSIPITVCSPSKWFCPSRIQPTIHRASFDSNELAYKSLNPSTPLPNWAKIWSPPTNHSPPCGDCCGLLRKSTGDVLQVIDVENRSLNNVIIFPLDGVFFVRSTIEIVHKGHRKRGGKSFMRGGHAALTQGRGHEWSNGKCYVIFCTQTEIDFGPLDLNHVHIDRLRVGSI
ncbi:hypothetical protein RJ641_019256 [Dillenia turbinata]|uniref:Uncharacterized protein n=1 Tax=Dillenia turbinata TaxID=194707 RepID=A0AAN8YY04_9MAGN